MSSSVFRQLDSGAASSRTERLFHAAITAFCALSKPSRAEIGQIDDLALSLLEHVSVPGRRFAAAALSDCEHCPPGLLRRLCDEPVEIAAPLLARSPLLSDADLIGLIERHGLGHARVIARRPAIGPALAEMIETAFRWAGGDVRPEPGEAVENMRRKLRGMMRGNADPALPSPAPGPTPGDIGYAHLRDLALLDHRPFFHTALADALGVEMREARTVAADASTLLRALQTLAMTAEQAFLIVAAVVPSATRSTEAIRSLLEGFAQWEAATAEAAASPRQASPFLLSAEESQAPRLRWA